MFYFWGVIVLDFNLRIGEEDGHGYYTTQIRILRRPWQSSLDNWD